ncbi:MAG: hypothetical protein V4858_27260 [Pseudomonadota bacterium]
MISIPLTGYELRFHSLFDPGRSFCFPCDSQGRVDLNALSDQARNNYLYSRAAVGHDLTVPTVQRCTDH